MSATVPNDLILYHYGASPYARRVVWYLAIRHIAYAECIQPPYLPRPDLSSLLQVDYRRIPLLAHAGHVYVDSRLILSHLESFVPSTSTSPSLTPKTPDGRGLLRLLERYTTDAGIFARAATLIPPTAPLLKDARFQKDREELTGREFSPTAFEKARSESLGVVRDLFDVLEEDLLADGREWICEGRLTLADLEAVWIIDWLFSMNTLPEDLFGKGKYPKTLAWHARFMEQVKRAKEEMGKARRMSGEQAAKAVLDSVKSFEVEHDASDPLGLQAGEDVTVWPVDSGTGHKDSGKLVALGRKEVVIEKEVGGGSVRVHSPRWGFRVVKGRVGAKL